MPCGRTDPGTDFDNGINNVDIDGEMTNLATNDLSYRCLLYTSRCV